MTACRIRGDETCWVLHGVRKLDVKAAIKLHPNFPIAATCDKAFDFALLNKLQEAK